MALLATIYCVPSVAAEIWNEPDPIPSGQGNLEIMGGLTIRADVEGQDRIPLYGISVSSFNARDYYRVIPNIENGQTGITINLSAAIGTITGVNVKGLYGPASVDLGSGSTILVTSKDEGPTEIYGIRLAQQGNVQGDNLTINLTGGRRTNVITGISISGVNDQSSVTLGGEWNKIVIEGNSGDAIYLIGQRGSTAELNANNLTIETKGSGSNHGFNVQNNSVVNLTGTTTIASESTAIWTVGNSLSYGQSAGKVFAEQVKITTTASTGNPNIDSERAGLLASGKGQIKVGAGSAITTANMPGVYAIETNSLIHYKGTQEQRNTITVSGQTGATAAKQGKIVLENVDVIAKAENYDVVGIRAVAGILEAANINVSVEDGFNKKYQSVAAVRSRNGMIELTGDNVIDASRAKNRVALLADYGGAITVDDQAMITGHIHIGKGSGSSIRLDLANGSVLTGNTHIEENGTINMRFNEGSRWIMTEDKSSLTSVTLKRGSALYLQSPENFNNNNTFKPVERTITGNFIGGGTLYFNTVLGDDNSATDRLTIKGDVEGKSLIVVNNVGGQGAETIEGIRLITVEGKVAKKDEAFQQSGRIGAGAYEYELISKDNQWYLSSAFCGDDCPVDLPQPETPEKPNPETPEGSNPETPEGSNPETPEGSNPETPEGSNPETPEGSNPETPEGSNPETPEGSNPETPEGSNPETPEGSNPETPEGSNPETPEGSNPETPEGSNPETPEGSSPPVMPPSPEKNRLRAEAGSYLHNQMLANNLFVMNLADREMGEFAYLEGSNEQNNLHQLWIRMAGGHLKFRDQSQQLTTTSDYYALQFGGLLQEWVNDRKNHYRLGLMGSIGNAYGTTNGKYHTKGGVNRSQSHLTGQSIGIYFTYYADEESRQGAYLDTWVQHNWFQNSVEPDGKPTEKYNSRGFTASLESGFSLRLNELTEAFPYQWYMQPHIQLTYMGVRMKGHREVNGTYVRSANDDNAQVKLGVRFALSPYATAQPYDIKGFADLSWISNSKDFGVSLDQTVVESKGAKNIGELKVGVEGTVNNNINLWGNIAVLKGGNKYRDTRVVLGLKYFFKYD
ncbi:hypothetical protein GCM10007162_14350 [Ignatzschineria ureiclastica]|nr:hypothetical protein GCM10007162_14350 [Ignatzschineria ureiclastica]